MNLALNARDAMPSGGSLTIETTNLDVSSSQNLRPAMKPGPYVRLTIRDTGTGMDARTKEHVFEPFFTTKPEGQGTGLGLSTVYGIVKQLNGSIWVDSEIGQGTAFHVYLPATVEGAVAAVPEVAAEAAPRSAPRVRATVLLVEDEESVRRYAKTVLELHGLRVIVAATPDDALSVAASTETPIDLMITDVVMPRMSGPDLAARLRRTRPELSVLYISGYPAALVQQGLLDPSMRLISKPFKTAELLATIDNILGQP
jgi:CheY-like chemotaxis protein